MSHDAEADWASAELARLISDNPSFCFSSDTSNIEISSFAGREGRTDWPHADGVIEVNNISNQKTYNLAIEYKRPNEGLHGILTAVGQSHAYLQKGYSGSFMVLPKNYNNFDTGNYVKGLIENTSQSKSIGICLYERPNSNNESPFKDKLEIILPCDIENWKNPKSSFSSVKIKTQWAHMREGSFDPDAFYKYLQALKHVSDPNFKNEISEEEIPKPLKFAVENLNTKKKINILNYLSSTSGNSPSDRAWRIFWFENILHKENIYGWVIDSNGKYFVNKKKLKINKFDGTGLKEFFSERSDSPKVKLVKKLNEKSITISEAWEELAKNYHARAHSYREDIDSFLENANLVDHHGRLTNNGYEFVDAIERTNNSNDSYSLEILKRALITDGGMRTFLHYFYKLSDQKFSKDPLAFTEKKGKDNKLNFRKDDYLKSIEYEFANKLNVLKKVSLREGKKKRRPFQAELSILNKFGLISKDYRIGIGLVINWPELDKYQ